MRKAAAPAGAIDLAQVEVMCAKLAHAVEHAHNDEISLLRTARMLKAVHGDLRAIVQERIRRHGRTCRGFIAESALNAMERHLRKVLLDHVSLRRSEVVDQLKQALTCSFTALEALPDRVRT